MPYYMVSHFSVTDPESFQKYPTAATPIMLRYGGKILSLTGVPGLPERAVIEGTPQHVATAIVEAAFERGLLLLKAGIYSNCIRVLSPLTLTDGELEEALGAWEEALDSVLA